MSDQLDLLSWFPKGETAIIPRDGERLGEQLQRVYSYMKVHAGDWLTLREIANAAQAPEASASARIRDIRHMGLTVERRYVSRGLHKYRLVLHS